MTNERELIPHLFRTEYSKIISVLCRVFGIVHIEVAEDLVSDTFLLAAETWGIKGLPANPTAWLYTVAKNKAKDYFKHERVFTDKIAGELKRTGTLTEDIDLSDKNISDSQLQMMFTICHSSIPVESQIGLSLSVLCGFGVDEIADAFLTSKETIYKRLARAKDKLRSGKIEVTIPTSSEIGSRLETVLSTLYLLFNEGYYSASQNTTLRKDLCVEAMRLNYLLLENDITNTPPARALLSLMCFHASRFNARINPKGSMVLYEEQNVELWDMELIKKGEFFLNQAASGKQISKYHIEAAIAYWHTDKVHSVQKWESVLQLYNKLLLIEYSPMAALNRTYALSRARDKQTAIVEAEKLDLKKIICIIVSLATSIHALTTRKPNIISVKP